MRKSLRAQLKLPFRELRIFTSEGVEIYREDLAFMKDGMLVHVTEGQEFSQQNSFQIYEIVKELGEGGFGKVQLGRHRLSG
jgi:MAP/microtubule affinity-regulating kinase